MVVEECQIWLPCAVDPLLLGRVCLDGLRLTLIYMYTKGKPMWSCAAAASIFVYRFPFFSCNLCHEHDIEDMSQGRNRLYFGASFSISLLPALVGVYFISHDRTALSILLFIVSVLCMVLSTVIFLGYKTVKHGLPLVTSFLNAINEILKPISQVISHTKIIGPIVSAFIRCNFFVWFILLLMSDHMIRMVLRRFVGQHPTKRDFSVINAMDPKFNLFDESIPPTKHLQNSDLFKMRKKMAADSLGGDKSWINMLQRPRYSRSLAYTLSVASKLVYEDIAVIKHELTKTGFDVANTFKPIAYLVMQLAPFLHIIIIITDLKSSLEYMCVYSRERQ